MTDERRYGLVDSLISLNLRIIEPHNTADTHYSNTVHAQIGL